MGWFQRYGIPGAYFCGLVILWFGALYHCQFSELIKSEHQVKIAAGILAASFLSVGYLVSVLGQILYHLIPGIGIDTRARKRASIRFRTWFDRWLEYRQEAITVFQIMTTTSFSLDQIKWLLEWMSKRMDMIVINSSLILATVLAPITVWWLPTIFGLKVQWDRQWLILGCIVSIIVFTLSIFSWWVLTCQLVRVEKEAFKKMIESRV